MRALLTACSLIGVASLASALDVAPAETPVAAIEEPGIQSQALVGEGLPVGEIVPEVRSAAGDERYALYLPSSYDPDRDWPVLLVMDPRGRAVAALEPFLPAAESLGYVLVSAYGSLSDAPDAFLRNQRAVDAILRDLPRRVSVDPPRLYLTGLSGTSRVAWVFGLALKGNVAGILGCGGALPETDTEVPAQVPFAYFAVAGTGDFNYLEMKQLDADLARQGSAHRFADFEGGHQWMPPELATEALTWFRLRAMATGLEVLDEPWIQERYEEALDQARASEIAGDGAAAQRRFQGVIEDFAAWRDVEELRRTAEALAQRPSVKQLRAQEEKWARQERDYRPRFERWFERWRLRDLNPVPGRALVELQVPALRKQAAGEDLALAQSAGRRLAFAFVQLSFYLPRGFRGAENHGREIALLEIAQAMYPERRRTRFNLAKAYGRRGRFEAAFEHLRRAVEAGPTNLEGLETDPEWEPLRGRGEWQQILAAVREAASR